MRFDYRGSAVGAEQTRVVDPYGLFRIGGHWYAVGRDHDRDAIRTFRVGRIVGTLRFATKNPRDFSLPTDFDPDEYRARPPWLLGEIRGRARVAISEDLCWWVERTYPHLTLEDPAGLDPAGRRVLATAYADESALIGMGHQPRRTSGAARAARAPALARPAPRAGQDFAWRLSARRPRAPSPPTGSRVCSHCCGTCTTRGEATRCRSPTSDATWG